MRRPSVFGYAVGPLLLLLPLQVSSQSSAVTYIYDEAGRLVGVVDTTGASATYKYDAVGNLLSISRQAASAVSIIEFTPNKGPKSSTVTIYGTGFSPTPSLNTIRFGDGTSSPATILSSTASQIAAVVPVDASSGKIAITTPLGSAVSNTSFVIGTKTPSITSFSPNIAVPTAQISVNGKNFETEPSSNRLTFNIEHARITSSTSTLIQAPIPSTGSGKITVATPYGEATSNADLFIAPPPYAAADVAVTDRMNIGPSRAVPQIPAGKIGMVLFDGLRAQRISVKLSNMAGLPDVALLSPFGAELTSSGLSASDPTLIEPIVLSHDGSYTLKVAPFGSNPARVTLQIYDVPPDVNGAIIANDPATQVSLPVPGQKAFLTFAGSSGQAIRIRTTQSSIALTEISVLSPNGNVFYGPALVGQSTQTLTDIPPLPSNGTFTILVDPYRAYSGDIKVRLLSP